MLKRVGGVQANPKRSGTFVYTKLESLKHLLIGFLNPECIFDKTTKLIYKTTEFKSLL